MNSTAAMAAPSDTPRKQPVWQRMFWFGAGAVVNYLIISLPLKYLKLHHPGLPDVFKVGISVTAGTFFFFFWNYFVNFRTGSRKRDALARYLVAAGGLWLLQWLTLSILDGIDKAPLFTVDLGWLVKLKAFQINRDVVATQFCLGGFKFLIYHYWAFPAHKERSK